MPVNTGHSLIESANEQHKRLALPAELEYIATTSRMQDTVGIWDILSTLWRRKWLIFAIVMSIMTATVIALSQVSPTFRAQSLLIIESRTPNIAALVNVAAGLPADPESIQSQMVILRSPSLAKKVINRLELQDDPEFNAALRPPGWLAETLSRYKQTVETWLDGILRRDSQDAGGQTENGANTAPASEKQRSGAERSDVVNAFLDNLEVSLQGNSRVIAVAFSSHSAETAARVTNSLAEIYLQGQREAKQEAAELDTDLLDKRVASLREKVESADQAVAKYRRDTGLLQGDKGSSLITQQLTESNAQLILARAARAQAEARFQQIQKLAKTPGGIESSSDVMNSALIPHLREQEVELQRQKREFSSQFGPRHPSIRRIQSDINDVKARTEAEEKRIMDAYRNEAEAAKAREELVQNDVEQLKTEVAQANEKEIKLRSLEGEANADRVLLSTLLSRLKETRQQQGMDVQQADARIVSLADAPDGASFPKSVPTLMLALVGSSLFSMLVVLISEQRDRGFRSSKQVEEAMGVPVLGFVPKLSGFSKSRRISNTNKLLDQSNFELKEAMRSIYESILVSQREGSPRKLLITSSVPKEGKTAIAVSLAQMEAFAGSNVVVVDADLRGPDIHNAFGTRASPGLVELVSGEADLDTVLRKDPVSGAWFIPAGKAVSDPLATLTSTRLDEILEALTERYDLVILDSPPSNMFVDARILSAKVEKTLLVVRWGETPQEVVLDTFKRHAQSGAHFSGVVLSMTTGKIYSKYR